MSYATQTQQGAELNRLFKEDTTIHEWYRFVLSYPPHLVREYIKKFDLRPGQTLLDPFCGTGTTLVEAMKNNVNSIGVEANPVVHFAATTKGKLEHRIKMLNELKSLVDRIAGESQELIDSLAKEDIIKNYRLQDEQMDLLIDGSITQLILSKSILLLNLIDQYKLHWGYDYMRVIFAKHLVHSFSNLKFGPEIGVSRYRLVDAPVVQVWRDGMFSLINDLRNERPAVANARVIFGDSREIIHSLSNCSIDAVITSPPYPNEKDYSRTTRLEAVVLGYTKTKSELRHQKKGLISSNTKNVYKDIDDSPYVSHIKSIQDLSHEIEEKRIELNKTSGFEKLYHKVVKLYFGGLARHLAMLRPKLRPGANLAYVVGDQASYFQIPIHTGVLLGEIATSLGFEIVSIEEFRTRISTKTGHRLREEVVWLRVPAG